MFTYSGKTEGTCVQGEQAESDYGELTLCLTALIVLTLGTSPMNEYHSPSGLPYQKSKGPGIVMNLPSFLFLCLFFPSSTTLKQCEYVLSNMLHSPFRYSNENGIFNILIAQ